MAGRTKKLVESVPTNTGANRLDGKGGAWHHRQWHDVASSLAIFVARAVSNSWTSRALDTVSKEFRNMQGNFLAEALADMVRPLWWTPTQWSHNLITGLSIDGYPVMPPTLGMLQDVAHSEKAVAFLSTSIDKNLFMREAAEMEVNRTHFSSAGASFVFCLKDDDSLGSDSAERSNMVVLSVSMRNVSGTISHLVIRQYLDDGQNTMASGGVAAQLHLWDMEHHMLLPFVNMDMEPLLPSDMLSGWDAFPVISPWSNFSFVLYFEEEFGVNLVGLTPISEHGRQVGVMSYQFSLSFTLTPLLQEAVDSGGAVTENAFLAVHAADGTVIGLSEDAAGGGGARTIAHASVETIPEDSFSKKAINLLRRQHGDICPAEGHLDLDEEDDRLVDVMPSYTEEWGLPSLGTRWCQVLTVPRDNLKSSFDRSQITSLVVGFIAGGGFAVALCLLSLSVWRVLQTLRQWGRQKRAADYAEVLHAVEEVGSLGCPMVLIGARDFLELEKLVCCEDLRDAGKLVVLDSRSRCTTFARVTAWSPTPTSGSGGRSVTMNAGRSCVRCKVPRGVC